MRQLMHAVFDALDLTIVVMLLLASWLIGSVWMDKRAREARTDAWDFDEAERVRLAEIIADKRQRGICLEPGCDEKSLPNEFCIRHNGGIR